MAEPHGSENAIVIIRKKHGGDEEGHHGGVWKIAFADFMTALMAFFLVMWLIAANDKVKKSIVHYFEPLPDAQNAPRGLEIDKAEIQYSRGTRVVSLEPGSESSDAKNETASKKASADIPDVEKLGEELQTNPPAALDTIAGRMAIRNADARAGELRAKMAIGASDSAAYRDPWEPVIPSSGTDDALAKAVEAEGGTDMAKTDTPKPAEGEKSLAASSRTKGERTTLPLTETVRRALVASVDPDLGVPVAIKPSEGGISIELIEGARFSMFANGSAVPDKRLVLVLEKLGQALEKQPGTLVIRGFTDDRPFRSRTYDNWQLSIDRAQAIHYMLVRGGLEGKKIARVEGYADHGPTRGKTKSSPLNRRIEVILQLPH